MFYNALAWFILFDALYCSTMFSNVFLECGIVFFDFNVFNALYCLRMRFNALQQRFCFYCYNSSSCFSMQDKALSYISMLFYFHNVCLMLPNVLFDAQQCFIIMVFLPTSPVRILIVDANPLLSQNYNVAAVSVITNPNDE